jgi:hypothetical protein
MSLARSGPGVPKRPTRCEAPTPEPSTPWKGRHGTIKKDLIDRRSSPSARLEARPTDPQRVQCQSVVIAAPGRARPTSSSDACLRQSSRSSWGSRWRCTRSSVSRLAAGTAPTASAGSVSDLRLNRLATSACFSPWNLTYRMRLGLTGGVPASSVPPRVDNDHPTDGRICTRGRLEIGPHTVLHPFEVPAAQVPGRQPMFERGRLDYFALNAVSEDAFREIRRRVSPRARRRPRAGSSRTWAGCSFTFHDPDDAWVEVCGSSPAFGSRTPRPGPPSGR